MFAWLKKKAAQQSLFNVELNTRTLIAISNEANAIIETTGAPSPVYIEKVRKAQQSLLTDIELALANGASLEDVRTRIQQASAKETVSDGASMAVEHVFKYVSQ